MKNVVTFYCHFIRKFQHIKYIQIAYKIAFQAWYCMRAMKTYGPIPIKFLKMIYVVINQFCEKFHININIIRWLIDTKPLFQKEACMGGYVQ